VVLDSELMLFTLFMIRTVTLTELPDKTMEAKCLQGMFELIDSAFFNETKVSLLILLTVC